MFRNIHGRWVKTDTFRPKRDNLGCLKNITPDLEVEIWARVAEKP